jgi:hypothetical protein
LLRNVPMGSREFNPYVWAFEDGFRKSEKMVSPRAVRTRLRCRIERHLRYTSG